MYDDGPHSPNMDCTSATASGCWDHRRNILSNYGPHPAVGAAATKVDGVYDADPQKFSEAKMFSRINYLDVLSRGLKVMDTTAISMCMDNSVQIIVFNLNVPGNLKRVILGEKIGSLVSR